MEISPGEGLECFALGCGINDILRALRSSFLPLRPRAEVLYNESDPLTDDIVVGIDELGVQLKFETISQRLKLIDVFDARKSGLGWFSKGKKLHSPPAFGELYKLLGPIYPGSWEPELDMYVLRYPGLTLMFNVPEIERGRYVDSNELPLELADGSTPNLMRMMIYAGEHEERPQLPEPRDLSFTRVGRYSTSSPAYLEEVCFHIHGKQKPSIKFLKRKRNLKIGDFVQDLLTELGPPNDIYFKGSALDKKIGSRIAGSTSEIDCFAVADYFYNYFDLGLDFLLDGDSHRIKKVIAHSNVLGHSSFSTYNKCEFRVIFENSTLEQHGNHHVSDFDDSSMPSSNLEQIIITPQMKWQDVETLLGPNGRPMIHDNGIVANPFGATHLYVYKGCVFEVTKTGRIAKITVFNAQKQ